MAEKKKQESNEHTPDYWSKFVMDRFNDAKSWRGNKVEKQWMINDAWLSGNQNMKYNPQTKQIVTDDGDPFKFFVNEIYSIVRAIQASTTKDQPTFEVDSKPYGNIPEEESRTLSYFLLSEYERMELKSKVKDIVRYGLTYSVGVFEYGYDPELEDGDGALWVNVLDPFDVYIDPMTSSRRLEDCNWIIKVVKKRVSDLQKSDVYVNTENLKADNQSAASEWKQKLIVNTYGNEPTSGDTNDSILVYEMYVQEDEGIRIISVANNTVIRNEMTDLEKFPFILYAADNNPGELYGEGWIKNLVPLNRALNILERTILEYNILFSKGKYITDRGSDVKTVTNRQGEIIRVSRGSRFEQLDLKPMNSTIFNQVSNLRSYISEIGASNDAFMGKTPAGVKAARAIEVLVANNMNNLSDLIDNLEITLQDLGTELLRLGYKYFATSKQFKQKMGSSQYEIGKIISGKYSGGENVVKIPERTEVKVNIVSGLAHTKEAKVDTLMTLRSGGDVDRRTLLENLDLPADEIELRLEEERQGMPISSDADEAAMEKERQIEEQAKLQARAEELRNRLGGEPPMNAPVGGEEMMPGMEGMQGMQPPMDMPMM